MPVSVDAQKNRYLPMKIIKYSTAIAKELNGRYTKTLVSWDDTPQEEVIVLLESKAIKAVKCPILPNNHFMRSFHPSWLPAMKEIYDHTLECQPQRSCEELDMIYRDLYTLHNTLGFACAFDVMTLQNPDYEKWINDTTLSWCRLKKEIIDLTDKALNRPIYLPRTDYCYSIPSQSRIAPSKKDALKALIAVIQTELERENA